MHGLADSSAIWAPVLKHMTATNEILVVDLAGHGISDWLVDGDYTVNCLSELASKQISVRSARSIILVGHSLGGELAVEIADANQSETCGVVVIDHNPYLAQEMRAMLREFMATAKTSFRSREEYEKELVDNMPRLSAEIASWLSRSMLKEEDGKFALLTDPNVSNMLAGTTNNTVSFHAASTRTLIIRGANSSILSKSDAGRFCEALGSQSWSIDIPDSGHAVPLEQPAAIAAVIDDFVLLNGAS
ncbi:alpha/beta hydrolase [Rhizobium laguerreae]|nr:alpha/beta hydrolase [Rhizobium laguerreae]